jgi:adenylate cyclase
VVWLYQGRTPEAVPPRPQVDALVPETVPFVSDRDRAAIRSDYLSSPDHKAVAISSRIGFVTGQSSEQAARNGALAACQRVSEKDSKKCELYAVGTSVVLMSGRPPMPPEPWVVRNPAIERSFAATQVPLLGPNALPAMQRYAAGPKPKAVAVSSRGYSQFNGQGSEDEAMRRALEFCGSYSSVPCLVVAVNDVFVVAIPALMKPVGVFHAATEVSIAPDARGIVASRLANAAVGWNAVAVGIAGRPGLMLRAADEREAIEGALADCGRQDRNCRMVAIGPFLVEPLAPGAK